MNWQDLIPPPTVDELAALRESIAENGVREPIVVDQDGAIIDGRNRARLAEELGVPCPSRTETYNSELDRAKAVVDFNAHRRHLSRDARRAILQHLREMGMTQKQAAKVIGIGERTARRDENSDIGHLADVGTKSDSRQRLTDRQESEVRSRAATGETQRGIARDFGVAESTVSGVVKRGQESTARRARTQQRVVRDAAKKRERQIKGDALAVAGWLESLAGIYGNFHRLGEHDAVLDRLVAHSPARRARWEATLIQSIQFSRALRRAIQRYGGRLRILPSPKSKAS